MRVAHVITRLIIGGAQENTVYSVLGLRQKPGLEVSLLAGPTHGPEGTMEPLATSVPGLLTVIPDLVRPVRPLRDWRACRELIETFRRERPSIVHTHSGKAGVLGRLAAAKAGVPLIIHTVHGPSFGKFQGVVPNALFTWAEKRAARVTDHFVVVANAMRDQYLRAGIAAPSQYSRIWSGFDLEPFLQTHNDAELRRRYGLTANDIVIGKIARLVELKGHQDLFAIAPDLVAAEPRLKFLLVGDGHYRAAFEQLSRRRGLEKHVVFTGLVPPQQVPALVGIMDVLVHLSAREGLARALPQALAAGRPVVVYDCDGASEICFSGETGCLVPPGDIAQLREALLRLAADPDLRARMGARGRDWVRERFGVQHMVDALYDLYHQLASAKGIPFAPAGNTDRAISS